MPTPELRVEAFRGAVPESEHLVHSVVVDREGNLLAASGNPALVTWWRSAAKPFQALPLVQDGVAARFGLTDPELALACASHSSEPEHLTVVSGLMDRLGLGDQALACGPHTPLSAEVARRVAGEGITLTSRWSNCSGKHVGMIALARHHGWAEAGYQEESHPVQLRILAEVAAWTGRPPEQIGKEPDGCTAVCFALPLSAMALGYARLAASSDPAARRIVAAMTGHPFMVAGTGRLCTDLMLAWPGRVIPKVGALGIYCAGLPGPGIGIALKVADGDTRAASVALLEVLRQVLHRFPPASGGPEWDRLARYASPEIRNSREVVTGAMSPRGELRFYDR